MKRWHALLTTGLFVAAFSASGETPAPKKPALPPMTAPSASGPVVTPPVTGNEEMVKRPPANIDPGITAPTDQVDRKNRQKSRDKEKAR